MTRLRSPYLASRFVLVLGVGAAAALGVVSCLDFGDPGAAVLERLEREAASEGRLVLARWEERLQRPAPLAKALGEVRVDGGFDGGLPVAARASRDGEVRLVGARAAAARGQAAEAERLCRAVLEEGRGGSGEALLQWVTTESMRAAALTEFGELAGLVPWNADVGGTSGRLLAILSAAPDLGAAELAAQADDLLAALGRGAVTLPSPEDSARVGSGGWTVTLDPWWTALTAECQARLGQDRAFWDKAFWVEERRDRAFLALAREVTDDAWSLREMEPGLWLAARRAGDASVDLALHSESALAASVGALGSPGTDLVVTAFSSDRPAEELIAAGELSSAGVAVSIGHMDPGSLVQRERRRLTFLRAGLWGLAVLLLVTTAIASRLMARARALHGLRSTFVASVSHDLRTPLASIRVMADNLASGYAKGREERYVESIRRETGRLGRLVDDLLDFGRIERGLAPTLQRSDVDVEEWLDQFGARERARCAAQACGLSIEVEGSLGHAHMDTEAVERALGNLIDNAIKHGGSDAVRLSVRRDAEALLTLEVEDEGRGVRHGVVHEHLFRPFEREGRDEGTGLGLTIVRAIAEAHGGTATLAPGAGGRGVRATIALPLPSPGEAA